MTKWIKRIEVEPKFPSRNLELESFFALGAKIIKVPFFKLVALDESPAHSLVEKIMVDKTLQHGHYESYESIHGRVDAAIEVCFRPGVTDNSAKSLEESFSLFEQDLRAYSGILYLFIGATGKKEAAEIEGFLRESVMPMLHNKLIQEASFIDPSHFQSNARFEEISIPNVEIEHDTRANVIDLDLNDESLLHLSHERCLALNLEEMRAIKEHYQDSELTNQRKALGLAQMPTDVELEVLAQTWSEHCKHKIFSSLIEYTDQEGNVEVIDSIYKSYIKKATKDIEASGKDWLVSVFSDNAGIVRFDTNIDLCIKVETHNSPSALDPYGGAITGILGVNRDILGAGLGARPIANTDVFCFASTEMPSKVDPLKLPAGLMEPERLLKGVHKGVEDGGNKSGIPTINGAIVFDQDFAGKPLVFCGTIGMLPPRLADGRESSDKGARVGHHIFVLGGAVGADGIHGATFSSMELGENPPATAVQIGDPLTQKRVMDFLLEARDLGLYSCVTDNGAGGISSSIGEMAELTGGARIDLNLHPRKYPGLSPWEIMISESQERMTVAVKDEFKSSFSQLASRRGVLATNMGVFTDSGFLEVFFGEDRVALLNMKFLHEGVPQLKLKATFKAESGRKTWIEIPKEKFKNSKQALMTLLNSENIASKEPWVRQYDHEVQGATIQKPFPGVNGISPGDSGVLDLGVHGGEGMLGVSCGLAPRWSFVHAGMMAKVSVDEAFRNLLASGVDPDKVCVLDNFCWPDPVASEKNPEGEEKLGMLVKCSQALYEICTLYSLPLVSGKDSMKNDFRGKNRAGEPLVISIQPTLLVTAMGHGKIKNLTRSVAVKGLHLFEFGPAFKSMKASEFSEVFEETDLGSEEGSITDYLSWDFVKCKAHHLGLYQLIDKGLISACHDISDGGLICAVSEMLMDENVGLSIDLESNLSLFDQVSEGPGRYVVGVSDDNLVGFKKGIQDLGLKARSLGVCDNSGKLTVAGDWGFSASIKELCDSWRRDWGIETVNRETR